MVGWLIAERESAALAEKLLADTIAKQGIDRDQLTIHADNGSSMASKPVAFLLADLGVTKSHSRPHTSATTTRTREAQFRTLKYRPDFPDTFGTIADARAFCQRFFTWYNTEHRHSGIGWHHPASTSTMDTPRPCAPSAPTSWPPPTPATPNGSSANTPNQPPSPPAAWINKPSEPDRQGHRPVDSMNP